MTAIITRFCPFEFIPLSKYQKDFCSTTSNQYNRRTLSISRDGQLIFPYMLAPLKELLEGPPIKD